MLMRVLGLAWSFFAPEPWHQPGWERWLLRVILVVLLLQFTPYMVPWTGASLDGDVPGDRLDHPIGLAAVVDLSFLQQSVVMVWVRLSFWLAAILIMARVAVPVAALVMLVIHTAMNALVASNGSVGHGLQVLGLMLLGFTVAAWWPVIAGQRISATTDGDNAGERAGDDVGSGSAGRWAEFGLWSGQSEDRALHWARITVPAIYFCSTLSKAVLSEGSWLQKGRGFILAVKKTQASNAADDNSVSASALAVTDFLAAQPWIIAVMLILGGLTEFTSPLMMLNRRVAAVYAFLLIGFHLANTYLMNLPFLIYQIVLVIYFICPLWWIVSWAKALAARRVG